MHSDVTIGFAILALAGLAACCDSGTRARIALAGPRYVNDCDAYLSCDDNLVLEAEKGFEVEVSAAYLSMVLGVARGSNDEPEWGSYALVDVTADFSVDGGVISLPGEQGYCTVRITTRPEDENPLASSVDMWFWMDAVRIGVKAALNVEVGPFPCDLKPSESSWIILEIDPLDWFDDVTSEMISELGPGDVVEPGDPAADAILSRISAPGCYRTLAEATSPG